MTFHQSYRGRARYRTFHHYGPHRLVVAVECRLEGLASPHVALLDTGAEWSLLPTELARLLGFSAEYDEPVERYSVRGGTLTGRRARLLTSILAHEGEELTLDASWFIADNWVGPIVIGWSGCLESFRFALDPTPGNEYFYFD
ncbi:MAG: hypothetical protein HY248_06940 [Fimbriimonas ginsengisoli]|nr:hypothetical protein [Fimbriimonas ginsengisoli]